MRASLVTRCSAAARANFTKKPCTLSPPVSLIEATEKVHRVDQVLGGHGYRLGRMLPCAFPATAHTYTHRQVTVHGLSFLGFLCYFSQDGLTLNFT